MTVTSKQKFIQHRTNFQKMLQNLCSGLALINFISTDQKDVKLGRFLDNDDMTSPSEFGEVTRPISYFMGRSVFYRQVFSAFY